MNNAQTHNSSVKPQQKGTHANFAILTLAVLVIAITTLLDSPAQTQAWIALIIAVMTGSCVGYASHTHYRGRSITHASKKARNAYPTLLFIFFFLGWGQAMAGLNDGLVAYYPFNGNTNDESSNDNHGLLSGTPKYVNGISGQAIQLDGISDFISLPFLGASAEGTIAGWVQWRTFNYYSRFFDFGIQDASFQVFNNANTDQLTYDVQFGDETNVYTGFQLQPDTWYHIAMIVSNDTGAKLYLNGSLISEAPSLKESFNNLPNNSNYFLGKSTFPADALLNGLLDEVRIYNRELSATEINTLAAEGYSLSKANLIVNGDFESGNTGFTSEYSYSPGDIVPDGVYDLVRNPASDSPSAASYGDHTSGTGFMMAINGSTSQNVVVWSQAVSVQENTDYSFSGYVSSWFSGSPSVFNLLADGTILGTITAPSTAAVWQAFGATFNSGSRSSINLQIVSLNNAFSGNDFALDDLSLNVSAAIPSLFNTGVDASMTPLPDGTIGDPHYSLVSVPGGTTDILVRTSAGGYPIPPYFGDDSSSAWIGP